MDTVIATTGSVGARSLVEICPRCNEPRTLKQSAEGKVCDSCSRLARRKSTPIHHASGATVLRAVRDPGDGDRAAYLCADCCPAFPSVKAWFAGRGVDIETALAVPPGGLADALKGLGAECDEVHYVRLGDVDRRSKYGRRVRWRGRCDRCRDRARFNWVELRDGGWVRRDFENESEGHFVCPDCGGHRTASMPSGKNLERATGRCGPCANRRKRTIKGVIAHEPSKAICLMSVRDPERTKDRAAFICARWAKRTAGERPAGCLGVDFAWLSQFKDDGWHGLCGPCSKEKPRHRKDISEFTFRDGPDGAAGTRLFLEGNEWKVEYYGCKCERSVSRRDALAAISGYEKNKSSYPPVCRKCLRPCNVLARMRQFPAQNGNGPKDDGTVKASKTRREREPIKTVNGKSLSDLDAGILKLYAEKGANSLVTLELVAQEVGLGRAGVGDGGQKNVSRLLERNGVADTFPVHRDKVIAKKRVASSMP